jgi:hypothetical protein
MKLPFHINNQGKLIDEYHVGRVVVPEWEIYSNPTIKLDDVRKRRFKLIDRGI